jgi:hypothetical protein
MAFMLGAIIGVLGPLITNQFPSSPFAIAFLTGYSIDAVIYQLDALVDKMKHPSGEADIPQRALFPPRAASVEPQPAVIAGLREERGGR